MNEQYVASFIKSAMAVGMPKEKIAQLLDKAQEISSRGNIKKVARQHLDNVVSNLLKQAGLENTASSVSYTNGILKEALDQGATPDQAVNIAQEALQKTGEDLAVMYKLASITQNEEIAFYAEGFVKAAMERGMSQQEAAKAFINVYENEKRANDGMFKQPMQGAPQPGPGAGAPPMGPEGDPGQGGGEEEAIQHLLEQLSPEQLQQLLAMIQGGQQGGPQGAPEGGPPMGGPQ